MIDAIYQEAVDRCGPLYPCDSVQVHRAGDFITTHHTDRGFVRVTLAGEQVFVAEENRVFRFTPITEDGVRWISLYLNQQRIMAHQHTTRTEAILNEARRRCSEAGTPDLRGYTRTTFDDLELAFHLNTNGIRIRRTGDDTLLFEGWEEIYTQCHAGEWQDRLLGTDRPLVVTEEVPA